MSIKFVFLCLFLVKNSFYVASTALDIVDTKLEEFPYVAFISSTWACPAALITENYLVTPAYCVEDASYVKVSLGTSRQPHFPEYTKKVTTQKYNTSHIFIHTDFAKRKEKSHYVNNIALIKLEQPVILTDKVRPGKLISIEPNILNEQPLAEVVGWWNDRNTDIQAETVELLTQTKCSSYFGSLFLKNQELCTRSGSTQYLNIMGNVLIVNKKIAGFKVKRYHCKIDKSSKCLQTHIFLNIAPFLYWISQIVGVPVAKLTGSNLDPVIYNEKCEQIISQINVTNRKLKEMDNKLEDQIENKLLYQDEYILNLENKIKSTTGSIQNENSQNYNELKENINKLGREFNDFLYQQKNNQIKIEERYNDIIHKENILSNDISILNKNINMIKNENSQNYNELKEYINKLGGEFNKFLSDQKNNKIKIEERYNGIIHKENILSNDISILNKNINMIKNEKSQNYNEIKENINNLGREFNAFLSDQKNNQIRIEERHNAIINKENSLSNDILILKKNINKIVELLGAAPVPT